MSVELGDQFQVIRDGVASTVYTLDRPVPNLGDRSLPIAAYISPTVLLSDYWTTTVDGETFPHGVIPDVEVDGWNMPMVAEEWIRETAGC